MITINLKSRFRNKAFIVALISAIVLLLQQMGLKQYIPDNWSDVLNTALTILMMFGVVVDTSSPGISDKVVENATVQVFDTSNEVKTESPTTSVNNTVSENSQSGSVNFSATASDKESETNEAVDTSINTEVSVDASASRRIKVDNPDNIISIGATVNSRSAATPQ